MNNPADTDWAHQFMRVLGDELRSARKQLGWTRQDLLEHLGADISLQTLATYELGTRNVYLLRFVSICHALDVSPQDILQRTSERIFNSEEVGWNVDLVAASQLPEPELAPLRRWATDRLESTWARESRIVRLNQAALEALAVLCRMGAVELAGRLPAPRPRDPT